MLTQVNLYILRCIFKILAAKNNQKLRDVFIDDEVATLLHDTGYRKLLTEVVVDDKDEICNILATYHNLIKIKAQIDHFVTGLQCIKGLYEYVKRYSDLMRPLFAQDNSKELTAGN